MHIHPTVTPANGIISVQIAASFIGDATDAGDQQRIAAYGDPQVDLVGLFQDPNDSTFQFAFPETELYAGVTTTMGLYVARFMTAFPIPVTFGQPAPVQGPMDCITPNPERAATLWSSIMDGRIQQAIAALRAKPAVLTTLPDATV